MMKESLKQKIYFHLLLIYVVCKSRLKKVKTKAYYGFMKIWIRLPFVQNMYAEPITESSCQIPEMRYNSVIARKNLLEKLLCFRNSILEENQESQAMARESVLNDELIQSVKYIDLFKWVNNLENPVPEEKREEISEILWQQILSINEEIKY